MLVFIDLETTGLDPTTCAVLEVAAVVVPDDLHYRQLDVSSLNELARRVWPDVYAARPGLARDLPHRALPDVYNSIAQARHYARAFGPLGTP